MLLNSHPRRRNYHVVTSVSFTLSRSLLGIKNKKAHQLVGTVRNAFSEQAIASIIDDSRGGMSDVAFTLPANWWAFLFYRLSRL